MLCTGLIVRVNLSNYNDSINTMYQASTQIPELLRAFFLGGGITVPIILSISCHKFWLVPNSWYIDPTFNDVLYMYKLFFRTVFEKYLIGNSGTATIFRIQMSQQSITFYYRSTSGIKSIRFLDNIAPQTWSFIAIQVIFPTCCSFFAS